MRQKWKTIPLGILFTSLVGTTVVTTIFLFANKDRPLNSKEQSAIESINELIIKNNDGIDKNINLSLLNPKDVQEKISSYLLKTKKSNKLKVQIKNFKVNFQEGSLQYKIILISNSFPQKEIKVRYAIGTWESESQAFERKQELEYINSLETREDFKKTINNLLKMSKTTVVPDEPPNLGSGIQNFINSHGIISNWNVQIQDYKNDTIFGNLSFMIILSKNYPVVGMRSRKILMKYPSGSFKVDQKKINEIEQLEINKITSDDIKNHDGINKSKNLLLLDQPQGLAEKLKNSVKSLKKFKNWRARISNYKPNQEKGSLEYIVTLTKAGFKQHVIKVLYPDNSFLTIAESNKLKEIEIIKNLNTDSLWANDEIRPETNVDTITKETLKTTLENYVNNIVGVSGWKAEITRFHKNIEERSLTYKVKFTKANFLTSKVITIEYPKNSLANTEIIKKQNEINNELQAIRNFKIIDLKGIDNINPDKKKIAPTEKKDWREELKTKIQNKIQGLELTTHNPKHIQWKVEVSEQIRNPLGSISYTITIESKDYSPLEIKTLPIYYTNEFQSDEEHEWEKEKQLLEEKIKVEDIDIKGNDQINPSKSETPPLEMPTNSNKNIQKHINEQFSRDKDGIQWKTNIINFESNPKEGSVSYKIEIFQERTEDKLKKIGKTLTIDYPAGSFKTEEEVLKEELNNFKKLFTIQEIKKNDGITTTSIYLPSKWKTEGDVLEHLKNKFLTDTNSLKWEKFSILHEILIKDFKPNDTNGSLSYTFVLTPYKEKEIKEKNKMSEYVIKTPISYDAGSFQTLKEYEESKIKKIQAKDLENVDGIIADSSKLPPIKPIDLKSKIEDYVQDQKKLSGWTVTINEYTKDKTTGSLKYTVKFAKNKFTRDILVEYKNKFQTLVQKQQSQLNKLDNSIIKGVDGIVPNLIKWAPSNLEKTIIKENLEKSLAFKKNTDSYYGWQAIISAYTPNHQEGSLSYKLEFQKNTLTTKSFTISYPQNSFKSWSQKEKDRILKLTNKEIRENDGITTKNDKFAPEKDDKLHEKLEDYVNNLDELSGWTAKINSYEVNHKEGKLKYSVTFDQSPQYPPKTLEINYSGFQKLKNFDWQIISNLNLDDLKKWDGIQPNYKTLASTISRDNVKGKLKNEINKIVKNNLEKDNLKNLKTYLDKEKINLPEVEVNFKENNYQADDKKGAISYTIIISRDYSKVDGKIEEKVIEVKYQKYSFRSLDKEEQDTINK